MLTSNTGKLYHPGQDYSYRELQEFAKKLNISAVGKKEALKSRIDQSLTTEPPIPKKQSTSATSSPFNPEEPFRKLPRDIVDKIIKSPFSEGQTYYSTLFESYYQLKGEKVKTPFYKLYHPTHLEWAVKNENPHIGPGSVKNTSISSYDEYKHKLEELKQLNLAHITFKRGHIYYRVNFEGSRMSIRGRVFSPTSSPSQRTGHSLDYLYELHMFGMIPYILNAPPKWYHFTFMQLAVKDIRSNAIDELNNALKDMILGLEWIQKDLLDGRGGICKDDPLEAIVESSVYTSSRNLISHPLLPYKGSIEKFTKSKLMSLLNNKLKRSK